MTELPERDDFGDYARWPGRPVLDPSGHRLGEVREIYLDDATDRPEWVLVDLGDDGPRFVPLADATVAEDAIKVAQDSGRVGTAPGLEPSKELTQDEERRLYDHYGLRYSEDESDSILPDPGQPSPEGAAGAGAPAQTAEGTSEAGAAAETTAPAPGAPESGGTTAEGAAAGAAAGTAGAAAALPVMPPSDGEDRPRPEAAAPAEGDGAAASPADAAPQPAASASAAGRPRLRRYVGAGPELPPPGETSEPADSGPMVPPRPEPVPPPRFEPEPEPGGPLAVVRKNPVPVAAGVAALVAALVLILLRRR